MPAQTVLLIDGDSDSLDIYSLILEHHGFRVLRTSQSEQGLRLAREHLPDLVIVEPFASAVQSGTVVEALRCDARTAHLPVLLITAVPALLEASDDRPAAPDRYLVKPCYPRRVLEEVERLLQGTVGTSH